MKQTVTVVCHREYGPPAKVASVERWPIADVQPNEVFVLMKAAPVSPADLNVLEGTYAIQPTLPAVVGHEGVGVVAQKGIAVRDLRVGQHVIAPGRMGSWCEAYVAPARELVAVPPGIDLDQAAMATSIVPAAWRVLHDFASLNRGDWVVQNAAGSAVGRFIIQFASHQGLKTVSVVRRAELKEELRQIGADVVLTEDELTRADIDELTGGAERKLGLDAVGGESAHRLAGALSRHATLVTYGGMSREPLGVRAGQLIFRDLTYRGFWMSEWYNQVSDKEVTRMFAEVFPLMRGRHVCVPIERTYPLDAAAEAIAHAAREGRSGKILFEMN